MFHKQEYLLESRISKTLYLLLGMFYLLSYHIFIIRGYHNSSIYCIDFVFSI